MKKLSWLVLVLVLEVPLQVWVNIPESERDRIRTQAVVDHCRKEIPKGFSKWRVYEEIKDFNWQLHVEPVEVSL